MTPLYNIDKIIDSLTDGDVKCILNLTDDWRSTGYDKRIANLLWVLDTKFHNGGCGPLVDCRYNNKNPGMSPDYEYKLKPLGLLVKAELIKVGDKAFDN